MRILLDAHVRVRIPTAPISSRALAKAPPADRSVLARMVSTSCCSTVNSGIEGGHGIRKMKPMREPRMARISFWLLPEMSSPLR